MMGMGMGLFTLEDQEDKVVTIWEHGYICKHCGERHVSDDTELWCAIAKIDKEKRQQSGTELTTETTE